ncbi:MAG: RNA 2'-phosphotransferase [Anaerolineae bacterium]|nr:RNA 2'-phosphotransferase [Anaerolineae bacterium]
MDRKRLIQLSKYLAKHLRHRPERLGLTLAPGGWVSIDTLLEACQRHGMALTRAELEAVVAQNDKRRFSFDASGTRIRASQGHSVAVDLQLEPQRPPPVLYHGTGQQSVDAIQHMGLLKMQRQHVHLSADSQTAEKVGRRHGNPVVFAVDAARMHADGHTFYCSDNGVWLVERVPPMYLSLAEGT